MAGEKILDIDDSPTVQRLIEMILASQGYQVILASDGEEGIAKARAERPAVILVDFVMPKMNGFQVCKTLKEDPEFRDTPIILVTSRGDKVGSKFVDVLGITEYFTKPFQPEELLAKIREVIDKRQEATAKPPARDIRIEAKPVLAPRPSAPPGHPAPQTAPGSIETMVRTIVKQVLDDFVRTTLPDIIQQELAKGQHGGTSSAGIQGNLASVRIVEVMQMLGLQRQTGRLVISGARNAVDIYFKDGLVVFATANCNGSSNALEGLLKQTCRIEDDSLQHVMRIAEMTAQPMDRILAQEKLLDQKTFADCLRRHTESAVYKAMALKEGDFYFEKATPPIFVNSVQVKVDDLLLEGARRADEWSLIQQKIPDFSVVFEPMIGNAEELTTRGMSDTDLKVFSLINGRRTIQEIIDMLCLGEFDVAKSMFILLSVNLIRRKR
jgi:CheY-like chemotaxis protein